MVLQPLLVQTEKIALARKYILDMLYVQRLQADEVGAENLDHAEDWG